MLFRLLRKFCLVIGVLFVCWALLVLFLLAFYGLRGEDPPEGVTVEAFLIIFVFGGGVFIKALWSKPDSH